jgi:adenylate cyclase
MAATRDIATLSALWVEMRDFARKTQRMASTDFAAFMDDFYRAIASVVRECGGTIDKFVGDAVLCFFQGPDAAVLAARRLTARLPGELPNVSVTCGVATGDVVRGYFGPDWHREHTAFGEVIKRAIAIQEAVKKLPDSSGSVWTKRRRLPSITSKRSACGPRRRFT